jgi:hypothetical protein
VSLDADVPPGAAKAFDPDSVNTSGTSKLTVAVSDTVVGSYPLTITAASDGVSHTYAVVLRVTGRGSLTRILIGVEQAGDSSSPSTDKFFLDFYNSRPLGSVPGVLRMRRSGQIPVVGAGQNWKHSHPNYCRSVFGRGGYHATSYRTRLCS